MVFFCGGLGERGYVGGSFNGGREFFTSEAPDFPALFKNDQKIIKKKFFSAESKEQ